MAIAHAKCMKHLFETSTRTWRLLMIVSASLAFCFFVAIDGIKTYYYTRMHSSPAIWLYFSGSLLTALMFLVVGSLVWYYARDRLAAIFLYGFCSMMMIVFIVQTGATYNDTFLSCVGRTAAVVAIPLLVALLFSFPKNYFELFQRFFVQKNISLSWSAGIRLWCVAVYGVMLIGCSVVLVASPFWIKFFRHNQPSWLSVIAATYIGIGLASAIFIAVFTYFKSSSLRVRQQSRLFIGGILVTITPVLFLTILPGTLKFLAIPVVDPRLSTLSFIIFPLSLGYSILRYQILVFDVYIRQATVWIVNVTCLIVLEYITLTACKNLWLVSPALYIITCAGITALLTPLLFRFTNIYTDKLFFHEMSQYRRFTAISTTLADTMLNLREVSLLITTTLMQTFETTAICLFVLEEEHGCYRIYPEITTTSSGDLARHTILEYVLSKFGMENVVAHGNGFALQHPLIARIAVAHRPLLLHELLELDQEQPGKLYHYIAMTPVMNESNVLFAPVRVQGKMIGVLVMGERGDHQPYAGPDFEMIMDHLMRFSSLLETARLYRNTQQQITLLNRLYPAGMLSNETAVSMEDIAVVYAQMAAQATEAVVSLWLFDERCAALCLVTTQGDGMPLCSGNVLRIDQESDWLPCFYDGSNVYSTDMSIPTCISPRPEHSFAWLPLYKGQENLGVLMVNYQRLHFFSREEMRILAMFVVQCAVALENARITQALRAAYERQKELDVLKDQFIMTASHELRTPLTAVQGYIDLLEQYGTSLSNEARSDFILKAHRGCDELVLMVENIMDASRIHIDARNINLQPIVLIESVQHVLEILGAMLKSGQRRVTVDIDAWLTVRADPMRLRQIILNLVNNALKYSPTGTPLEITAYLQEEYIVFAIHDYGLGIPIEEQSRLFERFMRLERDLNSPVRGAGLGLYICKQLVEAMGGHIWVESSGQRGEGSTFMFTLRTMLSAPTVPLAPDMPSSTPVGA